VQSDPLRDAQKRYRLVCYPRVFDKSSWSPDSQYCAASVSGFKSPNDGQLSWDIKEAEIWRDVRSVYIPNIGHDRDPDYYEQR
jgi:hypothetical protein